MDKKEKLIQDLLWSIFWKEFTIKQRKDVIAIIEDEYATVHEKATDLCDYLKIERRFNRNAMTPIIGNYLKEKD